MTTIAIDIDNGIIVADTRTTRRSTITTSSFLGLSPDKYSWVSNIDGARKIHLLDNDTIVVGAGNAATIDSFVTTYPQRVNRPNDDNTIILVMKKTQSGIEFLIYESEKKTKKTWFSTKTIYEWSISGKLKTSGAMFIGSGKQYARGAYDAGSSITESIQIAANNDCCTNDIFDMYDMNKKCFSKTK